MPVKLRIQSTKKGQRSTFIVTNLTIYTYNCLRITCILTIHVGNYILFIPACH